MKRQITSILCVLCLFACLGDIIPRAKAVSDWTLASSAPAGAVIVNEKWVYDKRTYLDSREPNLSGYTLQSAEWVREGGGSTDYASFPSGFDTGHWIYSQLAHSPYSAYENQTKKRDVSNVWKGYVYWHWMYPISGVTEWSTRQYGLNRLFNSFRGVADRGYNYTVFRAFLSTNPCQQHWASNGDPMYYDCTAEYGKWDDDGQLGFWRFDYYTSSYTDYYRLFHYVRNESNLESSSPVSASNEVHNVRHYVKYKISFTVKFDGNGGSVSTASKTITQGKTYGDLPTPTRTNYSFAGWFTAKDGGTQIKSDTTVNLSGNQTLYAHWTYVPPTYTVTFDANGGNGSMSPRKVPDDGNFVFPKCEFTPPTTPPNAEFDGWLLNGTVYQPGDSVKLNADAAAVAQWYSLAVSDILSNWGAVTVQLSNAVKKPVSVAVCVYSNAGKMLSCATRTVDSGATANLKPDITGAAYLQAFLLSPDTSAPLCAPFRKNINLSD